MRDDSRNSERNDSVEGSSHEDRDVLMRLGSVNNGHEQRQACECMYSKILEKYATGTEKSGVVVKGQRALQQGKTLNKSLDKGNNRMNSAEDAATGDEEEQITYESNNEDLKRELLAAPSLVWKTLGYVHGWGLPPVLVHCQT